MRLAVVGVGAAGSRVANRLVAFEQRSGRTLSGGNALLVTSKPPAFDAPERVSDERRVTIGDVHDAVDGGGTRGDPDLGADVARAERGELVRAFDLLDLHRVDGVLVLAGLAGGTGGGAGAVVIDRLQSVCDEPVYAVGVLPSASEGGRAALTAARSLRSFVEHADNVIVFDNDAWVSDPPVADRDSAADAGDDDAGTDGADGTDNPGDPVSFDPAAFAEVNEALAERLVALFAAGEFGDGSAPENVMDPSDIARTLDTGGVSTVGYASTDLPPNGGVRSWLRAVRGWLPWSSDDEEPTDAARITHLVRRAAGSALTVSCESSSADRALVSLSGPPRALSRKGFESGRHWLEREADVVDVKAGDDPIDGSTTLSAVVLLSNVTDVPPVEAMQTRALDYLDDAESERGRDDPAADRDSRERDADWGRFETADPR
ncbi:tubulin/FtsZ family protein [Candidatus Halobonum tyrrellensis]|uniref:Tubulin-like protein CetZ n=1 Tax=Candidatus Halobonum tyrrellensis G22 TaxID=1324957 RepID=V4GY12_9EURY|nr:tubulin/FtsZ family protein [Candidatus Halobonum tyrrellensis]ESP90061.1 Tubulin/FtsZ GTPase [Candidatus Halobonum tyrrellensis G22]